MIYKYQTRQTTPENNLRTTKSSLWSLSLISSSFYENLEKDPWNIYTCMKHINTCTYNSMCKEADIWDGRGKRDK